MMSLQFSGQSIFVGLGESKKAIFFSIFRKVIIVVPLTILLPSMFGMGTNGHLAEIDETAETGSSLKYIAQACK